MLQRPVGPPPALRWLPGKQVDHLGLVFSLLHQRFRLFLHHHPEKVPAFGHRAQFCQRLPRSFLFVLQNFVHFLQAGTVILDQLLGLVDVPLDHGDVRHDDDRFREPQILYPQDFAHHLFNVFEVLFPLLVGSGLGKFHHEFGHLGNDLAANVPLLLVVLGHHPGHVAIPFKGGLFVPHQQQHLGVLICGFDVELAQIARGTLGVFREEPLVDAAGFCVLAPGVQGVGELQLHGPRFAAVLVCHAGNDLPCFVELTDRAEKLDLDGADFGFSPGVFRRNRRVDEVRVVGKPPLVQSVHVSDFFCEGVRFRVLLLCVRGGPCPADEERHQGNRAQESLRAAF